MIRLGPNEAGCDRTQQMLFACAPPRVWCAAPLRTAAVFFAMWCGAMSGCAVDAMLAGPAGKQLQPADFLASQNDDAEAIVPEPDVPAAPPAGRITLGAGDEMPDDAGVPGDAGPAGSSVAGTPPPPGAAAAPRRPLEPGDRVIVESMVGQINGRPFFADRFFVPIADQLAALGRQLPMRDFLERGQAIIANHLQVEVLNALFVAEAQALLSPEEQVGLRAWIMSTREVITARRGGGTVEAARQRIRDEEGGLSLEEYVDEIRDAQLLRQLFERRIEPRVIVSQLDIEREYARRFAEFNPPARVRVDRIRLSARTQAELIEEVTQRLADGEAFADIAAGLEPSATGVWQEFQVPGGDLTQIEFPDAQVQEAMHALSEPGSVTRPIPVGTAVWWLSVGSVEQAEGLSVFDPWVQRQLASDLRAARMSEEQQRFTNSLLREGIYDEMGGMVERLLVIAADRYGPR